ncbi:MAG: preprotein translocase subunit SecY [Flavobacteriales bacterium]|nr:preprotein translocase subunit SecY [Bacteroidota bacterium]MCB9241126.1 preprotein translocase subunit SecY [Flavobacteriales bacterium]
MKKLIQTIRNIFSIEELKTRILNTLLLLTVFRVGTFIRLPGIDKNALDLMNQGNPSKGLLDLINTFAGGAFERASIFALGIMPYISASIVVQLLTVAVPSFQKMSKEGEDGRRKMNQITRYLTIAITAVQAISYIINFQGTKGDAILPGISPSLFMISSVCILVAGTMFTMWLGERITDRGLGNGISLIIMVGIISMLPYSILAEFAHKVNNNGGPIIFVIEIVIWLLVILSVVLLVQGTRRIPVQYAKRIVGNRQYGGVRQYLPLKVNAAGVMPIIFAQALMFIPGSISGFFPDSDTWQGFVSGFVDYTSFTYNFVFFIMIVLFTYFYTAITINPNQIADDLKRNGGFIPGVKPGRATANFIDSIMSRITLPGAIFLGFVSIFPAFAIIFGVNNQFAQFFGGTSLLIMVGVVLDTLQQIESHLLMRHYDGLMKSGRIKGRSSTGGAISA